MWEAAGRAGFALELLEILFMEAFFFFFFLEFELLRIQRSKIDFEAQSHVLHSE